MSSVRSAPSIAIEDITTIFADTVVLYRLGLAVPANQVTVLLGPSGAGKTTLVKHVVGLLEPHGGTVRIDSRDIWDDATPKELRAMRKFLGAMIGGSWLSPSSSFTSMTVLENLTFCLAAHGIPPEERHSRAMACLRDLHLSAEADRFPETLPAHANKRIALARALVVEAPLTALDGIDKSLGQRHFNEILAAVRSFHERTNCTLLITTHDPDVARALADQVAIIVDGQIVAHGRPEELLAGIETAEHFHDRFEFSNNRGRPRIHNIDAIGCRSGSDSIQNASVPQNRAMSWAATLAMVLMVVSLVAVLMGLA